MFFLQRLFLSSFWLSLSITSVLVGQWLEKAVASWLGDTFKLIFTNIKDLTWNYLWGAIGNYFSVFWSDITGTWFIDILIKIFIGLFLGLGLLFLFGLTEDKDGKKFLGAIVGIPILIYIFAPPLLPYLLYLGGFYSLGIATANAYYLIGHPATIYFILPIILLLGSLSNFFSYNSLEDSIYASWIREDRISIANFFDFWLYTLRVWIMGQRMYETFWQYWVALPLNLLFSSAFIFASSSIAFSVSEEETQKINQKATDGGYRLSSHQSKPLALLLAILFVGGIIFSSIYWATEGSKASLAQQIKANSFMTVVKPVLKSNKSNTSLVDGSIATIKDIDTSLTNPKILTMDGSVTMVKLIKLLRNGYAQVNPNIPTTYGFDPNGQPKDGEDVRPTGSGSGLKNLIDGRVLMAATSRPLKPDEAKAGIKAIAIARDAIAVVIGKDNQFKGSLTKTQLRDIYTGKIAKWSEVGGANLPIKVYNRSPDSGTQGFFKDDVLLDEKFTPDSPNFKTWERDETTAVLRVLGNDGIYYTTISQAEKQPTIKIIPIDGISPENRKAIEDRTYPIVRYVYLAIPKQTNPAVKQFIDFALSPEGQSIVEQAEFIRVK